MNIILLVSYYYLPIILLTSFISSSLSQPNIVKSLPGYPGDLPFSLETGYTGVGKEEAVQSFYYFIESERDVKRDPLMIWLTGGPGCSAFSGLVIEIGPLTFNVSGSNSESDTPKLQLNPYSWTKVASIIFLDSPVGTGFSYATTSEGYYRSDTLQSAHIYDFMRKWLIKHPKFIKSPFYVSGNSYSGRVIPLVVHEILQGNGIGLKPKLNLKGYVIGNPVMQQDLDGNAVYEYAHRVSLLPDELFKSAVINCNGDLMNVDEKNTRCLWSIQTMDQDLNSLKYAHVLEHECLNVSPKPQNNFRISPPSRSRLYINGEFCRNQHYLLLYSWADDENVREALGIREGSIGNWLDVTKV